MVTPPSLAVSPSMNCSWICVLKALALLALSARYCRGAREDTVSHVPITFPFLEGLAVVVELALVTGKRLALKANSLLNSLLSLRTELPQVFC